MGRRRKTSPAREENGLSPETRPLETIPNRNQYGRYIAPARKECVQ